MKPFIALFFGILLVTSCQDTKTPTIYPRKVGVDSAYADLIVQPQVEKKTTKIAVSPSNATKPKIEAQGKPTQQKVQVDQKVGLSANTTRDTLKITYAKGEANPTKSAGQTNLFSFNSDTAKKVSIKIIAQDTLANLRINHIQGPVDSIKGGPFGKTIIYNLPARGYYHFSVSEKPSLGKPYTGTYKVEVKLLWK